MNSARSPLANPQFGLAWSNRDAPNRSLIEAALEKGAFFLILEAVHAHGIEEVESVFIDLKDSDAAPLSEKRCARIDKALGNIRKALEDVQTSN